MRFDKSFFSSSLLLFFSSVFLLGATPADVTIQNFSPQEYGAKKQNWSIVQDNRGLMYFANSAGVLEFDSVEWRLIPLPGGGGANALAREPVNGRIHVGGEKEIGYLEVDEKGVMQYRSLFEKIPAAYRGFAERVVQVGFIPGGSVFLFERLLVILEGEKVTVFTAEDHFYSFIYAGGGLYIIDDTRGLLQYSGGDLTDVAGGALLRAYAMLPFSRDKILMVTTQEGPLLFTPGDQLNPFTPFSTRPNDYFTGNLVSCGIILQDRSFVLGSVEKGIAVFDFNGNRVAHIQEAEGLQDRHVYSIYRDSAGNLWAGLEQGISLLASSLFIDTKTSSGAAKVGGETEPSPPFAALIRGCRKSTDDALIFGGAYYIPGERIQSLRQERDQVPVFDYAYNGFRFTFGSNYYREIDKIMYSSYLEGLDKGWSEWMNRTTREYTNLYWGKYTLRVRARNAAGETGKEAAYTFVVKPPWHETFWFMAAQIIFIIMMLAASRLLAGVGIAPGMSEKLVIFVVVIVFEYVNGVIGPLIGRYSDGIAFFGMLMTGVLSFIISPAQEFVTKTLNKITRVKNR
ncbi:MAG TPA: triple tyrosine motif-containing protein [Candidatus Deferrimicrobium sp.]|nr:triple tyrosine motif-containing protein [Candidatus Deferrimicrobium sp.]